MCRTNDGRERPVHPDRAFERLVWSNPEVCNNCFQRCKRVTRVHGQGVDAATSRTYHDRTEHGVVGYDEVAHDDHGALRTYVPRTTCADCGSVGLLNQRETLSKRAMLDLVEPLVARLEEEGVDVDAEATRRLIDRLKSESAVQGHDREIFEAAVAFGVRWASRGDE